MEQLRITNPTEFEDLTHENLEICEHFYKVNIAIASVNDDNLRMAFNPGKALNIKTF